MAPSLPATSRVLRARRRIPLVLGGYAAFGVGWILLSDRVLLALAPDMPSLTALAQWKGLAFVLMSSLLLYLLLRPFETAGASTPDATNTASNAAAPAQASAWTAGRVWAVFAVLAATIVGVGLAGVALSASDLRNAGQDELRGFARTQVEVVSAWRTARLGDAQALGNDTALEDAVRTWRRTGSPAARELAQAQLRTVSLGTDYEDAVLVDAQGRPLLGGSDRLVPLPARTVDGVRRAIASGHLFEAGFVPMGPGGSMRFEVVAPLRGRTGADSFALLLRSDPSRDLLPRVALSRGEGPLRALLVARGDAAPVRLTPRDDPAKDAVPSRLLAWLATHGDQVEAHAAWPAGVPVNLDDASGMAMAVPGTSWVVLAHADASALRTATAHRAAWIALTDIVVLAAAAVLLYATWQRRELRVAQRGRAQQAEKLQALRLLDAIANGSTDAIYAKDREGRYLFVNDEACRLLGQPREALIGRTAAERGDEALGRRQWAAQRAAMNAGQVQECEGLVELPAGPLWLMEVHGPLRDPAGAVIGMFGVARDITARKREEDRMRQWAAAMASTNEGVMITGLDSRIVAINRAFTTITGFEEADAIGQTPALLRSGRQDAAFYGAMWASLTQGGHWQGEIWNRRRCGEVYPEWLTVNAVRDDAGTATHYVAVFSDISGLKRDEAQLERLAHYDALTELPNRRLLQERIDQALAHARRNDTRVAVLTLDVDDFKTVNDSLGHPVGDELLIALAQRLRERLRAEDLIGRLGGDEFLVLVDDLRDATDIGTLANDLLDAVSRPVQLAGGREVRVTASAGLALFPDDGALDAVEMLRNADAALYRAKDAGRNRFSFYTSDLNTEAVARLEMELALGRAIERRELALHYQPKVDAGTGRIVGCEALLRWFRPDGVVSPGVFMPIVEHSSLIFEVGGWVIDRACAQIRRWLDAGERAVPIAVNVAARQFAAGDLDVVVAAALQRHRVPPDLLEIELTESMLLEHASETTLLLHRLKALGVRLALDDFGTGYSSLAYLRHFPIDELKIDQGFVRDIGQGADGAVIVDAVIALAHRLHLRVVAEGVETEEQHAYLLRQGCDVLQGYRFARPAAPEALQALLRGETVTNVIPLRADAAS